MNSKIVVVTLTVIVVSLFLSACHHGHHRSAAHKESRAIEHLAKKLDLSPTQKAEFTEVQSSLMKLREKRDSIKADWYSYALEQFDTEGSGAEVEAFSRNQAVIVEDIAKSFAISVTELKNILTHKQEQILVAELKKHEEHFQR